MINRQNQGSFLTTISNILHPEIIQPYNKIQNFNFVVPAGLTWFKGR